MFELGQLRSFVAVATELHFGRAARRLNMTQPPLTRQIQLLERDLDVQLLARTSRSVRLTPGGRAFLAEAQAILQRSEAAVQVARRAAGRLEGAVTVGFIGAATYGFLPRLVAKVGTELPDVGVTFKEMASAAQLEALAFGRIDVGLVRPLPASRPRDVGSTCVMREGMALALPSAHPLAACRRPRLDQLDGEAFIMYSPEGRYLHDLLTTAFRSADIRPHYIQRMSHAQAILSLVSTGIGVAIVPEQTRNACFDNVAFRPIHLGAGVSAELHAIWRDGDRNAALPPLLELLRRL